MRPSRSGTVDVNYSTNNLPRTKRLSDSVPTFGGEYGNKSGEKSRDKAGSRLNTAKKATPDHVHLTIDTTPPSQKSSGGKARLLTGPSYT